MLYPDNPHTLAFIRRLGDDEVLVVANLSRHAQYVELDLHTRNGVTPVELFGQIPFPKIGEWPYLLTLPPYGFYWFALTRAETDADATSRPTMPTIQCPGGFPAFLEGRGKGAVERALGRWVPKQRWFGGKERRTSGMHVTDAIRLDSRGVLVLLVQVDYVESEPETYVVPVATAPLEEGADPPEGAIARLESGDESAVLVDAHMAP
jgi:maltose alpha-D-glucosyltransferase/alpha-amylase